MHRTRVAFKKFRYMVESLSPAMIDLGKPHLRRLSVYQRRMGRLQDLEILQACLADFVRIHPRVATMLKGFGHYLCRRHARVLRECLNHADDLFSFWNPSSDPHMVLTAA